MTKSAGAGNGVHHSLQLDLYEVSLLRDFLILSYSSLVISPLAKRLSNISCALSSCVELSPWKPQPCEPRPNMPRIKNINTTKKNSGINHIKPNPWPHHRVGSIAIPPHLVFIKVSQLEHKMEFIKLTQIKLFCDMYSQLIYSPIEVRRDFSFNCCVELW